MAKITTGGTLTLLYKDTTQGWHEVTVSDISQFKAIIFGVGASDENVWRQFSYIPVGLARLKNSSSNYMQVNYNTNSSDYGNHAVYYVSDTKFEVTYSHVGTNCAFAFGIK